MAVTKVTLSNGVRILVEPMDQLASVAIGLWCHTGSIDETPTEAGITHFIEHMLFKGTKTRTSPQIAQAIEGRGGMLNAFTDKERTCYYCRLLSDDLETGIDVLCDMVNNSLLDPEEIEREKKVVQEEIRRSEDEPGDHVHELHLEQLWPSSPYGLPVIGTHESVASYSRDDIVGYMTRRYHGGNLLLSIAGRVDVDEVVRMAESRLGHHAAGTPSVPLERPAHQAGERIVSKEVEQVHFCIGAAGCAYTDSDYPTQWVADSVMGSGMGSRLFQEVRERRGLAYAIGSYGLSYRSGGAYTVYGGTSLATWAETQEVVHQELDKLINEPVPAEELERVKVQLAGNMILGLEAASPRMMRMARNELNYGREVPIEEVRGMINDVTPAHIQEWAGRCLARDKRRVTAIVPNGA